MTRLVHILFLYFCVSILGVWNNTPSLQDDVLLMYESELKELSEQYEEEDNSVVFNNLDKFEVGGDGGKHFEQVSKTTIVSVRGIEPNVYRCFASCPLLFNQYNSQRLYSYPISKFYIMYHCLKSHLC